MKLSVKLYILLLFVSNILFAQENDGIFNYGKFSENSEVYLFSDNVNIREKPTSSSKVIANLPIASKVNVISETEETYIVNGYTTCWYKISFEKEGKTLKGYIWGGFLSAVTLSTKNDLDENLTFVYGISGYTDGKGYMSTIKAVVNKKIISSLSFPPMYTDFNNEGYSYNINGKITGNKGLNNVKKIIVLSFLYPACGYTNGDINIFWNETDLIFGIEAPKVSEAGIFHFSTEIIYPNDEGGKSGQVIKKIDNESYDEEGNIAEKSTKMVRFKWNGEKLIEQKNE